MKPTVSETRPRRLTMSTASFSASALASAIVETEVSTAVKDSRTYFRNNGHHWLIVRLILARDVLAFMTAAVLSINNMRYNQRISEMNEQCEKMDAYELNS